MNWLETLYPSPAFPNPSRGRALVGSTHYFAAYVAVNGSYPPLRTRIDPGDDAGAAAADNHDTVVSLMHKVDTVGHKDRPAFAPRITLEMTGGNVYRGEYHGTELEWGLGTEVERLRPLFPEINWPDAKLEAIVMRCAPSRCHGHRRIDRCRNAVSHEGVNHAARTGSKVALVTGGSKGIGKAIAYALAREGCAVAICARGETDLHAAAAEISDATGARVIPIRADMTVPEDIVGLVQEAVAELGKLDILVNNAVNSTSDRASQIPDEVILNHITTKVMGYIRCARECVPHMIGAGGGRIINIGGMAARNSSPTNPAPASPIQRCPTTPKLSRMTWRATGYSSIAFTPAAPVPSDIWDWWPNAPFATTRRRMRNWPQSVAEIPIGRMVEPDDIANLAAFLCSDLASAITGQTIAVDGGGGRGVHF